MDENIEKIEKENFTEADVGFMIWKLESIENFLPIYQSIMRKDDE